MIEPVLTFPRDGEVKWAALGASAGAIFSVLPLELAFFWLVGAMFFVAAVASGLGKRTLRTAHLFFAACFALTVAAAIAAPTKPDDARVRLSSQAVTLPALADQLNLTHDSDLPSVLVRLPSTSPTWRELAAAIESQTSFQLNSSGCGNGMSLLFGGFTFRRHLIPR